MSLPRLAFRSFTRAGSRATARTTFQRSSRRAYSAGAAPETPPGSDLPWAIGALAITLPGAYILLQPSESAHSHEAPHAPAAPTPAHDKQEAAPAAEEVTQPTSTEVEAQAETAVKADEAAEKKEEEAAQPAVTEEKGAEEEKAEEAADPVVPEAAEQSTETPSKKTEE